MPNFLQRASNLIDADDTLSEDFAMAFWLSGSFNSQVPVVVESNFPASKIPPPAGEESEKETSRRTQC